MEWVEKHLGGLIVPFGQKFEAFLDRTMFLAVNGIYLRAAIVYVAVFTPLLLLEFVFHFVRI